MAVTTKTAADIKARIAAGGTWGNLQFEVFEIVFANGDDATSTYDAWIIPAGTLLVDAVLWIDDGGVATSTMDVGIKSVSGTNQDSANYFFASVDAVTTAQVRKTANNAPLLTAQAMYLRSTIKVANQTAAFHANLGLYYVYRGNL
jgi:hypothetical protein